MTAIIITNETIMKAAEAAGLNVRRTVARGLDTIRLFVENKQSTIFYPDVDDNDNALIMDGADIDIQYAAHFLDERYSVTEIGVSPRFSQIQR